MSQQLALCLIAVAINLAGMLVIYALLSRALARVAWHGRGTLFVIGMIFVAQLFWIAPALGIAETADLVPAGAYGLWLGNWLSCAFCVVVFWKSAARIPVALADAARMDGLGPFAAWRRTVLPFVRRDFVLVALFTIMATLVPYWGCLTLPEAGNSIVIFEKFLSPSGRLAFMGALSFIGTLPLLAIFFLVKR